MARTLPRRLRAVDPALHGVLVERRRRSDRRALVLFLLVVAVFVIQTTRIEVQQHQIEHTNARLAAQAYHDCQVRNESATDLNRVLDSIIKAVREAPDLTAAEKAQRVAIYDGAKQGQVDCGTGGAAG